MDESSETPTNTVDKSEEQAIDPTTPWSIESETVLFNSLCKFKPVGIHKHFRMISLSASLNYYFSESPKDAPVFSHDSVWDKLGTLYDLKGLDDQEYVAENEDSDMDEDEEDEDAAIEGIAKRSQMKEFELPFRDYGFLQIAQAVAVSSSAQSTPAQSREQSVLEEKEEAKVDQPGEADSASSSDLDELDDEEMQLEETKIKVENEDSVIEEAAGPEEGKSSEDEDEDGSGSELESGSESASGSDAAPGKFRRTRAATAAAVRGRGTTKGKNSREKKSSSGTRASSAPRRSTRRKATTEPEDTATEAEETPTPKKSSGGVKKPAPRRSTRRKK